MTAIQTEPIACTLPSGEFSERMVWIAGLNRASLLRHQQQDLHLELMYAGDAVAQVRELVRREQQCCAFLTFVLREQEGTVTLTIDAPESARATATEIVRAIPSEGTERHRLCMRDSRSPNQTSQSICHCSCSFKCDAASVCGVCCVLPFALPSVVVSTFGGVFAAFAGVYWWALAVAVIAVASGWLWVTWQSNRTKKSPAKSTLYAMGLATVVLAGAGSWSLRDAAQPLSNRSRSRPENILLSVALLRFLKSDEPDSHLQRNRLGPRVPCAGRCDQFPKSLHTVERRQIAEENSRDLA